MHVAQPTIRIATRETWPTAIAVVLYLDKRDIPIAVENDWLFMTGRSLAESEGSHPHLVFGGSDFDAEARRQNLITVATTGNVTVYAER